MINAVMFLVLTLGVSFSAHASSLYKAVGCSNATEKMEQVYLEMKDWRERNAYTSNAAHASQKVKAFGEFSRRYNELYSYFLECGCNSPEFWSQSPEYIATYRNPALPKYCRP